MTDEVRILNKALECALEDLIIAAGVLRDMGRDQDFQELSGLIVDVQGLREVPEKFAL